MQGGRDVLHGRADVERHRVGVLLAGTAREDTDQARQVPDLVAQRVEPLVVQDRDAEHAEVRRRGAQPVERFVRVRAGLVELRGQQQRRLLDAGRGNLREDVFERAHRRGRLVAVDDGVGASQHAEQRPSPAAVLGGAGDQSGDLDQLDQDAAGSASAREWAEAW